MTELLISALAGPSNDGTLIDPWPDDPDSDEWTDDCRADARMTSFITSSLRHSEVDWRYAIYGTVSISRTRRFRMMQAAIAERLETAEIVGQSALVATAARIDECG